MHVFKSDDANPIQSKMQAALRAIRAIAERRLGERKEMTMDAASLLGLAETTLYADFQTSLYEEEDGALGRMLGSVCRRRNDVDTLCILLDLRYQLSSSCNKMME